MHSFGVWDTRYEFSLLHLSRKRSCPTTTCTGLWKTIVRVPTNASVARISLSLTLSRQVKEILAKERFDVVHLHEPLAPALPITVLRHSRTVNVGTFHTYRRSHFAYLYGKPLLKRYFNRLQGRIAVSDAARGADFALLSIPISHNSQWHRHEALPKCDTAVSRSG